MVTEVQAGTNPLGGTFRVGLDSRGSITMSDNALRMSQPIAHNAFASAADTDGDGTSVEEILEVSSDGTNSGT